MVKPSREQIKISDIKYISYIMLTIRKLVNPSINKAISHYLRQFVETPDQLQVYITFGTAKVQILL